MIANLPLFHRIAAQPVIVLGAGEAAEAKRRLVERAGGEIVENLQEGIDRGARLAFIAHDDDTSVQADAIRARCAGLLVNVTDRPELCDFTVPSVLDRAPVLIAIGTGGASAGLAKQLRLRLERLLPPSLGALADALYAAREGLRARWPNAGERRRALDAALGEGGPLDPLAEESADRVATWLAGEAKPLQAGTLEITLRSPDPEDLTLRQMRWLGAADLIASEPDVPQAILDRARADASRAEIGAGEPAPHAAGLILVLRTA
ncbi:NAD(P)-dependent oxidoreductase [Novosphingobium sp. RD2P27]|uniref:precorrin-2 dehydrogenase n=1 Tax=Novosphingobium kalidii TaxID=3230299 RepID=A0ABV2D0W3_9SPHN